MFSSDNIQATVGDIRRELHSTFSNLVEALDEALGRLMVALVSGRLSVGLWFFVGLTVMVGAMLWQLARWGVSLFASEE